jgi:16S rRNA (cytosine967-C5)-methyltransferase
VLLDKGQNKFEMLVTEVLIQRISPSRAVAFEVLQSVALGGYAADSLLESGHRLSSRDAGLASQIVFGCLRYQAQLDYLIRRYSGKDPVALDGPVLIALRAAIFQIRYLERVPAHAAVHESVEYVKIHKRAASGFVNAVLRKVNRDPVRWPDPATEFSCPGWLIDRWTAHFGAERARAIAAAALQEPDSYIRIRPGAAPPGGVEVEPTTIEGCFRLLSPTPAGVRQQDIGSQAIIGLLDLQPGQSYLDLCAAPGNKTVQALETPLALAIACDISPKRISDVPPVCNRVVLDATRLLPFGRQFDRIFIDAPCSGTGTLARNPEIKWRVQEPDFERFRHKQTRIAIQAAALLAAGGKLLYATCSMEREENEDVVTKVLAEVPRLRCTQQTWRLPGRDEGDGFYAALLQ